ncbi:transposase DDE domain protein [Neisseria meningitidis NM3642]|nr:transposase DDE domain protein [Neisseria meningitidis NM3642]
MDQKNGLYKLGYKQHARTDVEGYIEKLYITPTNANECTHLSPLLEGLPKGTTVYADKGYDSAENRQHLEEHQLQDGIMRKACRNRPLSETQTKRDRYLSKTRGDVFEPVESRQQAKCARCRPEGDRMPDYRVSRED